MRGGAVWSVIGLCIGLAGPPVQAEEPYLKGNDTGGIIPWSCESEAAAPELAADFCARFGKYPRITSVHRRYGDYITFHCLWTPYIGRFQIPPVATRYSCPLYGHDVPVVRALD